MSTIIDSVAPRADTCVPSPHASFFYGVCKTCDQLLSITRFDFLFRTTFVPYADFRKADETIDAKYTGRHELEHAHKPGCEKKTRRYWAMYKLYHRQCWACDRLCFMWDWVPDKEKCDRCGKKQGSEDRWSEAWEFEVEAQGEYDDEEDDFDHYGSDDGNGLTDEVMMEILTLAADGILAESDEDADEDEDGSSEEDGEKLGDYYGSDEEAENDN